MLLVAGPGSGKSATIEGRVAHLISQGIGTQEIFAISFTNASARDLRDRIAVTLSGLTASPSQPSVGTLHSLALRSLRAGHLIQIYPADPQVLDDWELRQIIDEEYAAINGGGLRRTKQIRQFHEAYINTGIHNPPTYVPPTSPVTAAEAATFDAFVRRRRAVYACVLPGEIVREAVTNAAQGLLNPVALLGIKHLIVDEFQDLNPIDVQFVHDLIAGGALAFACGDDDQSIYSFRHGSPQGMQAFPTHYASCVSHTLDDCFRCTPAVLNAAQTLISAYATPQRIQKTHRSLYVGANPPVPGVVHCWRFNGGNPEAQAVAASCASLIAAGLPPGEIMILLSNQRIQAAPLYGALGQAGVPYRRAREDSVLDTDDGRLCLCALRFVCESDDYVSQRVILGLQQGVGAKTCADIVDIAITASVSTQQLFVGPLPGGVFSTRQAGALARVAALLEALAAFLDTDTLSQVGAPFESVLVGYGGPTVSTTWVQLTASLLPEMTLRELRDYLWSDNDEQQARLLAAVYERLGQPRPEAAAIAPRVRVMCMHGAKGLSAGVVFIPGLEEELLPGQYAGSSSGGIYEAARLLYVSITRAKAACVTSYATRRGVQGKTRSHHPSQFASHLGGTFSMRRAGLDVTETSDVMASWNLL